VIASSFLCRWRCFWILNLLPYLSRLHAWVTTPGPIFPSPSPSLSASLLSLFSSFLPSPSFFFLPFFLPSFLLPFFFLSFLSFFQCVRVCMCVDAVWVEAWCWNCVPFSTTLHLACRGLCWTWSWDSVRNCRITPSFWLLSAGIAGICHSCWLRCVYWGETHSSVPALACTLSTGLSILPPFWFLRQGLTLVVWNYVAQVGLELLALFQPQHPSTVLAFRRQVSTSGLSPSLLPFCGNGNWTLGLKHGKHTFYYRPHPQSLHFSFGINELFSVVNKYSEPKLLATPYVLWTIILWSSHRQSHSLIWPNSIQCTWLWFQFGSIGFDSFWLSRSREPSLPSDSCLHSVL